MKEMKDSGIEWIGEIPSHWKLPKVKQLFQIGRGRVIAVTELTEEGLYPVFSSQTKNNGCLGYIDTYDFDRDQLTWTTDGANAGTVFLRTGKHNCTNVCGTLLPYSNAHNLKYLKFALEYIAIYHKRADINGYKIMNNEMADIVITLPSKQEQDDIADFLDKKCAEIDSVIEQTKATIEEYKKLKQSIITEAVTNGIRGDRPMKDSGIEWIGEIPSEWNLIQLKRYATSNNGREIGNEVDKNFEDAIGVYGSGGVFKYTDEYMYAGTAVMFGRKGTLGKPLYVDGKFWAVDTMYYLTYSEGLHPRYNYYQLIAFDWTPHITQTALPSVVASEIVACHFAIPSLVEQKEIANYLDQKCAEIDTLIEKKTALLEEMEALKKSTIFEYVTGKKKVLS